MFWIFWFAEAGSESRFSGRTVRGDVRKQNSSEVVAEIRNRAEVWAITISAASLLLRFFNLCVLKTLRLRGHSLKRHVDERQYFDRTGSIDLVVCI